MIAHAWAAGLGYGAWQRSLPPTTWAIATCASAPPKREARPAAGRRGRSGGRPDPDGRAPQRAHPAAGQPGRRLRLPRLCLAGARPAHRSHAEFCENGAKAVAEEATLRRITADFFAAHPISELASRSDHWLGQQGRLTDPMIRRAGSDHYRADRVGGRLRPDRHAAARARQPRRGGLLHLRPYVERGGVLLAAARPRVRHQQPARLLEHVPRVVRPGADPDDRSRQGQRDPRRHPRGEAARRRRARTPEPTIRACWPRWSGPSGPAPPIVAVNPLPEAGLIEFRNPQTRARPRRWRHRPGRPVPADPGRRRSGPVPGDRGRCSWSGARSTATLSTRTPRALTSTRRPWPIWTGPM